MKFFHATCCRLGRLLLVLALLSTALISGAVGDAIVLHQHGVRRAHLHVLAYGDLRSNAAWSSRFGHGSRPDLALQSCSQGVRILAIVTIGSVFVATPRGAGIDEAGPVSPLNCPLVAIAEPQEPSSVNFSSILCAACVGRTASAVILLRNHTLLL